jgi:hypothetical protein
VYPNFSGKICAAAIKSKIFVRGSVPQAKTEASLVAVLRLLRLLPAAGESSWWFMSFQGDSTQKFE